MGIAFSTSKTWSYIKQRGQLHNSCSIGDYLRVVSQVTHSGVPNYKGCRIALGSNFNLKLWEAKLRHYEDKQLVNLLRFGFPLGIIDRTPLARKHIENHTSAREYTPQVKDFIRKELNFGALLGPFDHPPHPEFHCSPLLTRPKDGNKRRVIVDLSFGKGDAVNQVTCKSAYEGSDFNLQLPTLDHVLDQVLQLREPRLIKVDVSRAFRNVPIDPRDAIKCGFQESGEYYVDKCLVFRAVNGTFIFQRISDAIRYMLAQDNIYVWNYIDDVFAAVEKIGGGR